MTKEAPHKRLLSLDTLRGFDMFFIMGGDALFLSLGAMFPDTFLETCGRGMLHAGWHGFTFEDLIFPLFLFLAGVSFPYSLAGQYRQGRSKSDVTFRVMRRGFMLILLGMVYNGLLQFDFENLRIASVLGRIGLAWMLAALLYVWVGRKFSAAISVVILMGYWALFILFSAPDADGATMYSIEGNIVSYVDRMLLPGKLHNVIHDPEGILSTLPAVVTALLGMFVGDIVKCNKIESGYKKCGVLALLALGLSAIGLLWNLSMPINKNLWTSSFVCLAGGLSTGLFALFYMLIDVLGCRRWTFFFAVIGVNSITIYIAQQFVDFSVTAKGVFGGVISLFPGDWQQVAYSVSYIAVCWLFLYLLYRNRIFLKV